MSGIRVGYMSHRLAGARVDAWRRMVAACEAAGLDHVGLGDHVSFRIGVGFDALLGAATVLGASERLGVNTAVYLLPLRHPVLVARQLCDLAALGPGRFTFGVGLGGEDPHELEICGVDPRTRGRRMDECLGLVRALLRGEPVDFRGDFFELEAAAVRPSPGEPIPILVGGRSAAAIRRAGRLGDGWFGIWVSARRYREGIERVGAVAAEHGRTGVPWTHALNVWCGFGADAATARATVASRMERFYGMPFERFERWSPAGSPAQVAEFLAPYAEAGCRVFNLIACGPDLEREIEAVATVRSQLVR